MSSYEIAKEINIHRQTVLSHWKKADDKKTFDICVPQGMTQINVLDYDYISIFESLRTQQDRAMSETVDHG